MTIAVGWGGAWGHTFGQRPDGAAADIENFNRVYTFALRGDAPFPDFEEVEGKTGSSETE